MTDGLLEAALRRRQDVAVVLPLESPIKPCRCGLDPSVRTDGDRFTIEHGDAKHFYSVTRTDRTDAIRDWNVSLHGGPA